MITGNADCICTIVYLFHAPNYFSNFSWGLFSIVAVGCHSVLEQFKFVCPFVHDGVINSSIAIAHAILYAVTAS